MGKPEHAPASGGLQTRAQAADYLSTSQRRLDELIRAGAIAAVRDGAAVKIHTIELERYIADLPAYEPATA